MNSIFFEMELCFAFSGMSIFSVLGFQGIDESVHVFAPAPGAKSGLELPSKGPKS